MNTTPSFITNFTRCSALISASGFAFDRDQVRELASARSLARRAAGV